MSVLELVAAAEAQPFADYRDAEDEKVTAAWAIENTVSADWAFERIAAMQREAAELDAQAKAAKARIDAKVAQLKSRIQRGIGFFEFKLLEYAERNRKALLGGGKKKSRSFVHGVLGWKSSPERLVVTDAKALEAWLATQPVESGLYRQTIAPEMKALQALFKEKGEVPPGCDIKPETDEPYVKIDAPEAALVKG